MKQHLETLDKNGNPIRNIIINKDLIAAGKTTPESHYTKESMVKDLLKLIPFQDSDIVLDAGSGRNKVWYNNIPTNCQRLECEIEDGVDFLTEWEQEVDWVIGNPPFKDGKNFVAKTQSIARKGFAFLGSHNFINSFFLPSRLETLKQMGFNFSQIHIIQDKRWYGRYYFIIMQKNNNINNTKITWMLSTY